MAYYDDADTSRAELVRVLDGMVSAGRITAADRDFARADIDAAYEAADEASYFGKDARTFWTSLAGRVNANRAAYAAWNGGKPTREGGRTPGYAYTTTILSGLTAFDSAAATAYASSWRALWQDVVVESASDYAKVAETVGKQAVNPWYVWGVAVIVLGVVYMKVKGK